MYCIAINIICYYHKILDLMGDLYLLGRPIYGKVTASCTGHTDNIALVRAIRDGMKL